MMPPDIAAQIQAILDVSRDMQADLRASVVLAYIQGELDQLLNPVEGE